MPKTDIKKIESEDLAELFDEALDREDSSLIFICMKGSGAAGPRE